MRRARWGRRNDSWKTISGAHAIVRMDVFVAWVNRAWDNEGRAGEGRSGDRVLGKFHWLADPGQLIAGGSNGGTTNDKEKFGGGD